MAIQIAVPTNLNLGVKKPFYLISEAAKLLQCETSTLISFGATGELNIVAKVINTTVTVDVHAQGESSAIGLKTKFSVPINEPIKYVAAFVDCPFYKLGKINADNDSEYLLSTESIYIETFLNNMHVLKKITFDDYLQAKAKDHSGEIIGDRFTFKRRIINGEPDESLLINVNNLYVIAEELDRFIKAQTEPTPETREPKELNPTERQSLHTIIKTLANFIIDPSAKPEKEKSDNERGKPPFKNQTQLIEFLSDKEQGMGEVRGFSKANLEKVFSKNNKSE